jgi:hypothetical protein
LLFLLAVQSKSGVVLPLLVRPARSTLSGTFFSGSDGAFAVAVNEAVGTAGSYKRGGVVSRLSELSLSANVVHPLARCDKSRRSGLAADGIICERRRVPEHGPPAPRNATTCDA